MSDTLTRLTMPAISAVIIIILGLQIFAGFRNPGPWGWPFVAYPMYHSAHYEGERVRYDYSLYGLLADGRKVQIRREDLGMGFWKFWRNVTGPLRRGDQEALHRVANDICARTGHRMVGLQLEDMGVIVARGGMKDGLPPEIVASALVNCD